ncbi:MAG: M50 family metallopeptidase [Anaerolineales bacterium]|nr:M50 family metallopeptidase [Anaerolineales bacterium]
MMKWLSLSWRVGRIRDVEIRFHFSILFSIFIVYRIFRPIDDVRGVLALLWLTGYILSVFLHELAHAMVAKLVHVDVKSIVIWLLGGFTNLTREPEKPLHRLAIYAAGPVATFLVGALCVAAYFFTPANLSLYWMYIYTKLFLSLAGLNFILLVFNILPIYPLDGGNVLRALMEFLFGRNNANLITIIVSVPVLVGMIWFGIKMRDYVLLAFCVLIALAIGTLNSYTLRWINLGLSFLFKRGGYYFLREDYERAVQYFTRHIEKEPQQANHYIARYICYSRMLQNEKAFVDLEHVLMIAPNNEMALLARGDTCLKENDIDSALNWYEQARQLHPNSMLPYIGRGFVMMRKMEFHSALEEFNKASLPFASVPLFYVDRSRVHFKLGNLDAAHKDQDLALHLSQKDALIKSESTLYEYEGYLDWAEDYYARAISLQLLSSYAYQGRADAYRVNHEFDKAILDYTRALEINPREPLLYLGRGKSYDAKGDKRRAAEDFRQVLAKTRKLHLKHQAEDLLRSLNVE